MVPFEMMVMISDLNFEWHSSENEQFSIECGKCDSLGFFIKGSLHFCLLWHCSSSLYYRMSYVGSQNQIRYRKRVVKSDEMALLICESGNSIFSIKLLITCTICKLWHPTNYSAHNFHFFFSFQLWLYLKKKNSQWLHCKQIVCFVVYIFNY